MKNKLKKTAELLKTWDDKTLRDTHSNYQNALTHYNQTERHMIHYKRMVSMIEMIKKEINDRTNEALITMMQKS